MEMGHYGGAGWASACEQSASGMLVHTPAPAPPSALFPPSLGYLRNHVPNSGMLSWWDVSLVFWGLFYGQPS